MSELSQVLSRLDTLDQNQRRDVSAIYAEMKSDRLAAEAKREVDRELFMQEIKNLFQHGCIYAESHAKTDEILTQQRAEIQRFKTLLDKGAGIIWTISALATVIGLISGWVGSVLNAKATP
jgi:uncharacterized protein YqgQ